MTTLGFLDRADLQVLIDRLRAARYRCVGPQTRDGAIVFDTLEDAAQLPAGVRDRQAPGSYRLDHAGPPHCFDWAVGPQALKLLSFASREVLWRCARDGEGHLRFVAQPPEAPALAVLGVRACDLAALALQDQHFLQGAMADPYYRARRMQLFLVAVHCTRPASTCFCVSTGDGPRAQTGFDLALQELDEGYLVEAGTERGAKIAGELPLQPPTAEHQHRAQHDLRAAAAMQTRRLPGRALRDRLFASLEHPRWQDVGGRCLACGNCTMVCPTCFCHVETETPALDGRSSEHLRDWDSCFTEQHSYFAHLVVRKTTTLRYRQWLTHKLGGWHDQFGRSGCVGCGRCITWCPVGIDITAEAEAICGNGG